MTDITVSPIYRIMDIPEADRPRERLASLGPQALSNAELIAIMFGFCRISRVSFTMSEG